MNLQRVPVPLPLLGLTENVSADQQEPGTTARCLNVRGIDPVTPGRVRLAQRSGLVAHGTGAQVAAGSPVVAMFQGVKDTPPDRWIENDDSNVSTGWTTTVAAEPVTAAVGPDQNCYTLFTNGEVAIHTERGRLVGTIDSQVPTGFYLVESLGIDEDGAVYTMASFARRQDGGAGRLYRMRKDGEVWVREAEYVFEWRPRAFIYDRGEILVTAARPEDWDIDPEADGPAPTEQLFRLGGVKGQPFVVWERPAAHPAVDLAANARGDIFVASPRNADRASGVTLTPAPDVDWVPRDAVAGTDGVNAWEALYAHYSALRAQNIQGLADNATPATWFGATDDPDDFDDVIDTPARNLLALPERAPVFDTNGMVGAPGFVFNGRRCFASNASTGFHEKETTSDTAQHCQTLFPNMRDTTGAGARFVVSMSFRIEAVEDATSGTAIPRYVFQQGDYSLYYQDDTPAGSGGDDVDFVFTYPVGSSTINMAAVGLAARDIVFTFVHAGDGVGSSAWFLHSGGVTYSATGLTVGINRARERTILGGSTEMGCRTWSSYTNAVGAGGGDLFQVDTLVWHRNALWRCKLAHYKRPAGTIAEPGDGSGSSTYWDEVTDHLGLNGAIGDIVVMLGGSSASTSPHDTTNTSTLYQKLEGFVAWAYGNRGVFPGGHPYQAAPPAGTGSTVNWSPESALQVEQALTAKYARANGQLLWVVSDHGMGSGVAISTNDHIYTINGGPIVSGNVRARRIKDNGRSGSIYGVNTWAVPDLETGSWVGGRVQIRADQFGDLYIAWSSSDPTDARQVVRYEADGDGTGGPAIVGGEVRTFVYDLGNDYYPIVALPAGLQVDESATAGATGPEFLFVPAVAPGATPAYSVQRVEVLSREATGSTAPREVQLLAVTQDGTISRWASPSWSSVASTALPGTYVWTATLFSKTFLGNGNTYRVYDHANKNVRAFEEATIGRIPPRCRLGCAWRGRLVIARGDSAHDWFMSATADPFDWDFTPTVVTETQAVSGASSQVGEVPDLVNALVPWSDDLLIFGCDSSIWRLTGDPMTSGELHRVSDVTGMAFGQSWCKDPEQRIYFWGSRGGMYVMSPDGGVAPLSEGKIHRRLQDIDLGKYTVRLVWNDLDQGVHAFLVPVDGKGEPYHYFFERRTGAFWPDQFAGAERQVRGVFLADGDAATDRSLLLGCADGRIRRWQAGAPDDDGERIRSSCLVGPVTPDTAATETRLVAVEAVLARDQGGASLGVVATQEADVPYHVPQAALLGPGRNPHVRTRARGSHLWLELGAGELGQSWAVEDLAVHVTSAGRRRVR